MTAPGYEAKFQPCLRYVWSTPENRPSGSNVRFLGLEVRSTSGSRRHWAKSAKTGCDPKRPSRTPIGKGQPSAMNGRSCWLSEPSVSDQ